MKCKRGHERTSKNSYPDGTCKLCAALRYQNNKEKIKNESSAWRKSHPQRFKELVERCRKKNPEKLKLQKRIQIATRRARESGAGGSFTGVEWLALCAYYGFKCLCCKEIKVLTPDHIIPISKGGTSNIDNIQPLCMPCNNKKNDKIIDYRK